MTLMKQKCSENIELLLQELSSHLQKSIEDKIETITKEIYGADGIEILPAAQKQIDRYKKQVMGKVLKSGKYLTHDTSN